MAEAVTFDQKRVLPAPRISTASTATRAFYVGCARRDRSAAVERVLELDLDRDEKALSTKSVEAVKSSSGRGEL